jgi:hypothetical protein
MFGVRNTGLRSPDTTMNVYRQTPMFLAVAQASYRYCQYGALDTGSKQTETAELNGPRSTALTAEVP